MDSLEFEPETLVSEYVIKYHLIQRKISLYNIETDNSGCIQEGNLEELQMRYKKEI
jgi:hypothetical protein